ncbi:cytochrome B [Pedobacter sp. MC2016-14]|uniref:cytochrome B n=1 Tax=Pedobacter sp. MC2016-14 TaxID=2897327 RepID=UPI001E2F900C|nr:cytochrome B [Pedobacter sp. MC2016-14]MCD0487151.1 cytochrome B [Pedobacter sp. MC2016-14]
MYQILKSAHSGWRYVVVALLLVAIFTAVSGWLGKKTYTEGNRKLNVFALISVHIQFLLGLVIYFTNGWFKVDSSVVYGRYWKMEHISMMILAVILVTIGNSRSKKIEEASKKHKTVFIFFGFALLIITVAILLMLKADPSRHLFGM